LHDDNPGWEHPPDEAGNPAAPPDRAGSSAVSSGRAGSPEAPPDMTGILSAALLDESNILKYVMANVLKQPSDSPLVWVLDGAGINEITDLLTLDHHSRNSLTYKLDDAQSSHFHLVTRIF